MKNKVFIIGGGNSVSNIDFEKVAKEDADIIVINKAISDHPYADYFITMDFTFLNKIPSQHVEMFYGTKIFIANFTFDFMKEEDGRIFDSRFNLVYDLSKFDMVIKSRQKTLGHSFNEFGNGQNSAFCAFQFALNMGYKDIYLIGFDMFCEEQTHYHGGYGEDINKFRSKLDEYYSYFEEALTKNIFTNHNIYSCSKDSKLNKFITYTNEYNK